ncbi:hypothetical protein BDZ45DRAFT_234250 [Acephala macrosclerotiorum]|nr:hypothetical protein BDZ45DRAFT_234250 [Acephala macrosclerotiorum]
MILRSMRVVDFLDFWLTIRGENGHSDWPEHFSALALHSELALAEATNLTPNHQPESPSVRWDFKTTVRLSNRRQLRNLVRLDDHRPKHIHKSRNNIDVHTRDRRTLPTTSTECASLVLGGRDAKQGQPMRPEARPRLRCLTITPHRNTAPSTRESLKTHASSSIYSQPADSTSSYILKSSVWTMRANPAECVVTRS